MKFLSLFLGTVLSASAFAGTICKGPVTFTKAPATEPYHQQLNVELFTDLNNLGISDDEGLKLSFGYGDLYYSGKIDPTGVAEQVLVDAHADAIIAFHVKVLNENSILFQGKFLDGNRQVIGKVYPATLQCE